MTHDDRTGNADLSDLPDALRAELGALRTAVAPSRDLWPGIATRLVDAARDAAATVGPVDALDDRQTATAAPPSTILSVHGRRGAPRRRPRRAWIPAAMAASVALALAIGWPIRSTTPTHGGDGIATALTREADAMTREYRVAFAAVDARGVPATDLPALAELDRSAAEVRDALRRDPDARFLFERLQRVYARRLDLSQRLASTG